jgi:hypothetical protein
LLLDAFLCIEPEAISTEWYGTLIHLKSDVSSFVIRVSVFVRLIPNAEVELVEVSLHGIHKEMIEEDFPR